MNKKQHQQKKKHPLTAQSPAPISVPISILPQVPVTYSTTQPLPGIALSTQSILRDIIERSLPVDAIKKLR